MAMENGGMSPADYAAISNNGWGDNSFFWVFALLLLGNGGFGGWGGNNQAVNALNADMQRGFDTQNLQSQTRDILSAVTNGTAQTISASTANATNAINAIKDGNASLIREFGNVETALTALSGKQQECCCDIKQLVQATAANTDAQIAQNATIVISSTAAAPFKNLFIVFICSKCFIVLFSAKVLKQTDKLIKLPPQILTKLSTIKRL